MLINTRYVVVRRWSLYFITLDRPNTTSPRFNLILGKLRAKIILTAWNIERSKIKDKVVDSWYLELQIFFFFQLLNLSSNRFLIKIEILRIVYYYERIISTIFLRLRLFMKRRCLIYVYSSYGSAGDEKSSFFFRIIFPAYFTWHRVPYKGAQRFAFAATESYKWSKDKLTRT